MLSLFVTTHARHRFKERFRYKYSGEIFKDGREVFILKDFFKRAESVDFAMRQRPGDYNAICIKYGCVVRYSKYRDIVFVWTQKESHRVLLTVLEEGCKVRGMEL